MGDRYDVERAIKRSGLPSPARLILFVLLTRVTNGTLTIPSEYAPSITTLEEETGLSRGALSGHLNRLESDGWLQRFRPSTREALAARARTSYRITVPDHLLTRSGGEPVQEVNKFSTWTGNEEAQVKTRTGDEPVHEANGTRSRAEHNPKYFPQSSSPKEKKKGGAGGKRAAAKTTDEHPLFADWYAAYPVRKARGAAVKAFAKAIKTTDPQILIAAAKRYRDDPQVARGYGKHPATWLNQECWLDEPGPAARPDPRYAPGSGASVPDRDAYDPDETEWI